MLHALTHHLYREHCIGHLFQLLSIQAADLTWYSQTVSPCRQASECHACGILSRKKAMVALNDKKFRSGIDRRHQLHTQAFEEMLCSEHGGHTVLVSYIKTETVNRSQNLASCIVCSQPVVSISYFAVICILLQTCCMSATYVWQVHVCILTCACDDTQCCAVPCYKQQRKGIYLKARLPCYTL